MANLIRNGQVENDNWKTLRLAQADTPHSVRLPVGQLLVPLSVWQARRTELIYREYEHGWALGVWLAADESATDIARDIDDFSVIAIEFDKFSDGNSYQTAGLLRQYGYSGELRAIGDVPNSRPSYLQQLGFDAIASSNGGKIAGVLATLGNFRPADTQQTALA